MNELEHFLKTATRGLWGKRKLEVREELKAHVLERARKHELLGLSREDAVSKSLVELGAPQMIRSGLQRTYSTKALFSLIWLGIILLGFTALPVSEQKQIPISFQTLDIEIVPIPLARVNRAQVKPIPLSKPGDANFAPIPLARPPAKISIKSR